MALGKCEENLTVLEPVTKLVKSKPEKYKMEDKMNISYCQI